MLIKTKTEKIKMLVMDVDGVLTDGKIYLGNTGEEFKVFDTKDGQGIKLAQRAGIICAIITGRKSKIVAKRAEELNIKEVYQGIEDKLTIFNNLRKKYKLSLAEIAYIGDDVSDLDVLKETGLAVVVADAVSKVKEVADYITEKKGGQGAVRELIDLLLNI